MKLKKLLSTLVVLAAMSGTMTLAAPANAAPLSAGQVASSTQLDPAKAPAEIAVAVTTEPTSSMSINWTTIDTSLTDPKVLVWEASKSESSAATFDATTETRTVSASTIAGVTQKSFNTVTLTGLTSDREYSYRVGTAGAMSEVKSFRTASENNGKYTFIYVSDSQVSGNHSKAWQANLDAAKKMYPDASFIYIAGDLTNTANDEGQWESFFNQPGNAQYNDTFSGSLISDIPLAAAMGNHDASNGGVGGINSHYTFGSDVNGVPDSYAFDYGSARMIVLNTENAYSRDSESLRAAQQAFLRTEVADAKAHDQWTIVGFHKSIYSGANHMDDADVIVNRKYWGPILADLNVDAVLQGHDHVLSRGFIKADGTKADVTQQLSDRTFKAKKPANAPLYYVGNTGSSLKFYAPIMSNDWIQPGDPVASDFGYLDINSALPAGYTNAVGELLNPGPSTNDDLEGVDPDFYRTPTFTAVTVTKGSIDFQTYMTGFDPNTNSITKDTFLYDSLKVTRPGH